MFRFQRQQDSLRILKIPRQEVILGILERPNLPLRVEELKYRIDIVGQPGVGKSTLASWLAKQETSHISSSSGTQIISLYCPCETKRKPREALLFHLDVWDIGTKGRKEASALLQNTPGHSDAIVILVSCSDRVTFNNLPKIFLEYKNHAKQLFFVGITGWTLEDSASVSLQELDNLEATWRIPVVRIPNVQDRNASPKCRENLLLLICEGLWRRDQLMMQLESSFLLTSFSNTNAEDRHDNDDFSESGQSGAEAENPPEAFNGPRISHEK